MTLEKCCDCGVETHCKSKVDGEVELSICLDCYYLRVDKNDSLGIREKILEKINKVRNISCPFCGEGDFDAVGLKLHLTGGGLLFSEPCEKYLEIKP